MNDFLLLLFRAGFIADPFPFDECNLVSSERGFKVSYAKYWVAVQDKRKHGLVSVYLCTPYMYRDNIGRYAGWEHCHSSKFFRMPAENWSENFDEVPVCFKMVED